MIAGIPRVRLRRPWALLWIPFGEMVLRQRRSTTQPRVAQRTLGPLGYDPNASRPFPSCSGEFPRTPTGFPDAIMRSIPDVPLIEFHAVLLANATKLLLKRD